MTEGRKCDCVECRIRQACAIGHDGDLAEVDIKGCIFALGNVLSEMLALIPAKTAKMMAAELLVARKKWLKEPRVAAQQPPAGHA